MREQVLTSHEQTRDRTMMQVDIRVRNNEFVHKDDVLFVIDQDRFRLAGKRRSSGRGGTRSVSHVARSIPAALEAIPRGHHHH